MNETTLGSTSKEMKEIHFFHSLDNSTLAPWVDPAHLKQCGSYHSAMILHLAVVLGDISPLYGDKQLFYSATYGQRHLAIVLSYISL